MLNTKKLNNIIKEKGLVHKYIADKMNMHEATLCRKIKGERQFKVEEALMLCKILNIKNPANIFFANKSEITDK